jgi:hypothetical protein
MDAMAPVWIIVANVCRVHPYGPLTGPRLVVQRL